MAVVPAQLLAPAGPVTPLFFPGEGVPELSTRLQAYIDNALLRAEIIAVAGDVPRADNMTVAFVLYTTYTDVYTRMSIEPMQVAVTEKGSHTYTAEQLRNIKALADKYWNDFVTLAELPVPKTIAGVIPPTQSISTDVRWN